MALDFGGSSDTHRVEISDNADIGFDGSTQATISAWIYPEGLGQNNQGRILDKAGGSGGSDGWNVFMASGDKIQVGLNNSSFPAAGSSSITLNEWNHFVVLIDLDAGDVTFYINGVEESSPTTTETSIVGNSDPLRIGIRATDLNREYDGSICECGLWKDKILGRPDILALSNGEPASRFEKDHLVGYWPLYGVSSPEPDLSGNGYHGTVTGATKSNQQAPLRGFRKRTRKFIDSGILFAPPAVVGGNEGAAMYHHLQNLGVYA